MKLCFIETDPQKRLFNVQPPILFWIFIAFQEKGVDFIRNNPKYKFVTSPNSNTFSNCHGSKLTNSLGWTKLTGYLRKQWLEFSTCTRSSRASLKQLQIYMLATSSTSLLHSHVQQLNSFKKELKKKLNSFYVTKSLKSSTTVWIFCLECNVIFSLL